MIYHVLIIGQNAESNDRASRALREVAEAHVDLLTQQEKSYEWASKLKYHLVIIDHESPFKIMEQVKNASPESHVILLSEQSSIEDAVLALKLGAFDYLQKPVSTEKLRLSFKRALDRSVWFEHKEKYSPYLNLVHACQMISASTNEEQVFAVMRNYFSRELGSSLIAIVSSQSRVTRHQELKVLYPLQGEESRMREIFEVAMSGTSAYETLRGDLRFYQFFERTKTNPGVFALRFKCVSEVTYYLVALSPQKPLDLKDFDQRIKILMDQVLLTGQNIRRYVGIQELAFVDELTGLSNYRELIKVLDQLFKTGQVSHDPFAVLFIDIDRFKLVNDEHGHIYGSAILKQLGQVLKKHFRAGDTICRYGGDEFVVILPGLGLDEATAAAERVRKQIERSKFDLSDNVSLKITVSIGVAVFPDHALSREQIVQLADEAMYVSKKEGRNRCYVTQVKSKKEA